MILKRNQLLLQLLNSNHHVISASLQIFILSNISLNLSLVLLDIFNQQIDLHYLLENFYVFLTESFKVILNHLLNSLSNQGMIFLKTLSPAVL